MSSVPPHAATRSLIPSPQLPDRAHSPLEAGILDSVVHSARRRRSRVKMARKAVGDQKGVMAVAELAGRRMTVEIDGDFVVFLIGARFNHKRQLVRSLLDLGGRRGMKHMLDYLVARPEKGLLAYEMGIPTIVQYWRSFEHLEAFARDQDDPHLEVWRQYWRRVGKTGRTGIWHETYLVNAGQYEAVYGNMPAHGLGKAGLLVPASEASSARVRLGAASR